MAEEGSNMSAMVPTSHSTTNKVVALLARHQSITVPLVVVTEAKVTSLNLEALNFGSDPQFLH